jgi:hypothetical protein
MPASDYNVPTPGESQTVTCLYCGKPQPVGKKAMSITCKFCHKSLKLEDLAFKQYEARRAIETCGMVTIEKKGNVIADRILCGGLVVRGKVKGKVDSRGPVLVGPDAEIKGDVKAPVLAVGACAILEGQYQIGELPKTPESPDSLPGK